MLKAVCAAVAGAALAGGAAAFASPRIDEPGVESATVAVAPSRAGVRPVILTVSLRTELKCGRLGGGTITLGLPAQMRVPKAVPATAVVFDTAHASVVHVTGHSLAIGPPLPSGVMCQSIRPGVAKIVLTKAANLGNPKKPGRYPFVVLHQGQRLTTTLAIR